MHRVLHTAREVTRFETRLVLPTLAFLGVWMALGSAAPWGIPGLVWAVAALSLASALARLPLRHFRDHSEGLRLGAASWVGIGLILALQLGEGDPVFSQRLWTLSLTGLAAGYLVVWLAAPAGLARLPVPWAGTEGAQAIVLPLEILRLLAFAVLNEAVIAEHDPALWVTTRALAPILLTPLVRWLTLELLIAREVETRT